MSLKVPIIDQLGLINEISLDTIKIDNEIMDHLSGISDTHYHEDNLLSVPVDEYAESLLDIIRKNLHNDGIPLVRKSYWPDFAPACAIITHDIDTFNNPPTGEKTEFVKYAMTRKVKGLPYNDNIENMKEIERKHGINSSFYFFSDYGKHQNYFQNVLGMLDKEDEIGLHGSQHSFQSHKHLIKEKAELEKIAGQKIIGTRQHGLNFNIPHTWRYQEKAGFEYDLTHAYNDEFGFRAGTCHPFHPFDSLTKERFDILEIPSSFMDWTALHQGMNYKQIMDKFKELANVIETNNGVFTTIFHNMYINEKSHPDITKAFDDILGYFKKKKYWIATAKECADWWSKRENADIQVKQDGNQFILESDIYMPVIVEYPDSEIKKIKLEPGKPEVC